MDEYWQGIPKFKELSFRLSFILIEIASDNARGHIWKNRPYFKATMGNRYQKIRQIISLSSNDQ